MITIHLLGDSIVTAYGDDKHNFIGGWGDHLWSFFDKRKVCVNCYAQGGRSTRSFLNEGRFIDTHKFTKDEFPFGMGPAYHNIQQGDYVFIEFAHNDDNSKIKTTYPDRQVPLGEPDCNGIYPVVVPDESMKSTTEKLPSEYITLLQEDGMTQEEISTTCEKYLEILKSYGDLYYAYNCGTTYKGFLKFYIDRIKEKGAIPVLVTPVSRRSLKDGVVQPVPGHHGNKDEFGEFPYVRAMKQLGILESVTVIDLFEKTKEMIELLNEDSKYLQSIKDRQGVTIGEARYNRPATWPTDYNTYMKDNLYGEIDDTHQNRFGSYIYAGKIAECIYNQIPELKQSICIKSTKTVACPDALLERRSEILHTYKDIIINI